MAESFSDQLRAEGNRLKEWARSEPLSSFHGAMEAFVNRAGANAGMFLRDIVFDQNAR